MSSMSAGTVVGIFIASEESAPVVAVERVRAEPGRGLEGDRYFKRAEGPGERDPTTEVTLIASEGLEAARREDGLELPPGAHRRNVVTQGVSLDDLVGKDFSIGEVVLRGLEQNPPCRHLAELTGKDLLKPLLTKGGIRAQILNGGHIRIGDSISEA
jgi:MOSC domain-containing protein YiiM